MGSDKVSCVVCLIAVLAALTATCVLSASPEGLLTRATAEATSTLDSSIIRLLLKEFLGSNNPGSAEEIVGGDVSDGGEIKDATTEVATDTVGRSASVNVVSEPNARSTGASLAGGSGGDSDDRIHLRATAMERRLAVLPDTGRTREQIIARLEEQMPKLYIEGLPWELFTEDVVYTNPYGQVRGKENFRTSVAALQKLFIITKSHGPLNFTNVRFSEDFKVEMNWETVVCSDLLGGLCAEISGHTVILLNSDLYAYSHTLVYDPPLPRLFFASLEDVFRSQSVREGFTE